MIDLKFECSRGFTVIVKKGRRALLLLVVVLVWPHKEDSTADQKEAHGNGADVLETQTVSKEEKDSGKIKNGAKVVRKK